MSDITSWGDLFNYDTSGNTDWASIYGNDTANLDPSWFSGDSYNTATDASGGMDWSWIKDVGGAALNFLGSQSGGTALGGLLGYLGARNAPTSTTTVSEPWLPQQPFLLDAFNQAAAAKGSPISAKANENYTQLLQQPVVNPMLGMDNPYLTKSIDLANQDVTRAMNPAIIQANRASGSYGNSGIADIYGKKLTDAYANNATNMRLADYTNQQNLQQQAVNNTLGFTTNAQNWASQPASNYANTVRGTYGGSSTTPLYSNTTSGLLGGALVGNKLMGG